jgi:hypothetical protein
MPDLDAIAREKIQELEKDNNIAKERTCKGLGENIQELDRKHTKLDSRATERTCKS